MRPLIAHAQNRVPTVGILWHAGSAEEEGIYLAQIQHGLQALGYAEGRNINVVNTFADEQYERFNNNAVELVFYGLGVAYSPIGDMIDGGETSVSGEITRSLTSCWACAAAAAMLKARRIREADKAMKAHLYTEIYRSEGFNPRASPHRSRNSYRTLIRLRMRDPIRRDPARTAIRRII